MKESEDVNETLMLNTVLLARDARRVLAFLIAEN